jgi:hypothetical protein
VVLSDAGLAVRGDKADVGEEVTVFSTRQLRFVLALVLGLVATTVVFAGAASAQTCGPADPYSGGTPNCGQQGQLTIELSVGSGEPGTTVVVDASGFKQGDLATITFGGDVVATVTVSGASIHQPITVPNVAAGTYDVCVSAPNAQSACAPFRVTPGTVVAGVSFTRGGGDSLAQTGFKLLPFLLLAVILILGGRYLVAKGRARG